jgi:RHS repeat-associated protein
MKHLIFNSVALAMVLMLGLPGTHAQTCAINKPEELRPITTVSRGGTATLVGFSEYNASSPPEKYLTKRLSGTIRTGLFIDAACTMPLRGPNSDQSASGTFIRTEDTFGPRLLTANWSFVRTSTAVTVSLTFISDSIGGGDWFGCQGATSYGNAVYAANTSSPTGPNPTVTKTFPAAPNNATISLGLRYIHAWGWSTQGFGAVATFEPNGIPLTETLAYTGASRIDPVTLAQTNEGTVSGEIFNVAAQAMTSVSATSLSSVDDALIRLGTGSFSPALNSDRSHELPKSTVGAQMGNAAYWRKSTSSSLKDELSDKDTEDAALQRAWPQATGSSNTAYRTKRTTGFSFDFSEFAFKVPLHIKCAGKYQVHFLFETRPHGAPASEARRFIKTLEREYESGFYEEGGAFDIKAMTMTLGSTGSESMEYDTDYTLIGASLVRGCDNQPAGAAALRQGSVHVSLSLGQGEAHTSAGSLQLDADVITAALYSPKALIPVAPSGGGTFVIMDSGGIVRQLRAPASLADIVTLNSTSYEVRFYPSDGVCTPDPVSGVYTPTGSPFVSYKFENPDLSQTNKLKITETRGSVVRVSEFGYDSASSTWSLSSGNGQRKEFALVAIDGVNRTETITIRDADNVPVSRTRRAYRAYPWGEELIGEELDPEGAALATTYEFYDNAATDGANYSHLRQRINADGSWERHTYDGLGRSLKTIRPHLNAVVTAAESLCRVTENAYSELADADGDGLAEALTSTIESTLGQETGRAYAVEWSKPVALGSGTFTRRSQIRCTAAGSTWDASTNLLTETLAYAAWPFTGRVRRVVNPDGTATLTTYAVDANGQQTMVSKTGQPNGTLDDIVAGIRTTSFTSATGQVIGESVTDIASGLTLNSWTATQFDALGRLTEMLYTDGTTITRDYTCCGLASETDRAGVITSYVYDDLGRLKETTRAGLTTRTVYDADGRITSTIRIGADGSQVVQETNSYSLSGRLIERKDALNRVTSAAEDYDASTGQTTRTTSSPAGTRTEVTARDGSLLSVSGSAAAPRSYEYGVENGQLYTKEILLGLAGATTEWVKNYTDFAGRACKIVFPDGATTQAYYNSAGQLVRQVDADGLATLFAYNARGEQEVTALDLDGDGAIDYDGIDRVTKTVNTVATRDGFTVQRATKTVWETNNTDAQTTVAISEQSTDGLRSWQTVRGLITTTVTALNGSGNRTVTTTGSDGTVNTQIFGNDRLQSVVTSHSALGALSSVDYGYDPHGRLQTTTDARAGTTAYTYYPDDQISTVTTPDPDPARTGNGYDPQVTGYTYDSAGRPASVTQPDGGVVTTEYYPTGQVKKVTGARTYPVEYTYDPQGRVKTLTTWQNYATSAGAAVTTWNYTPDRGFLQSKRYADNTGPSYTYKPSGRLLTRMWARGVVCTYGYNSAGDHVRTIYSDGTPAVSLAYDRSGRPQAMTDAAGTRTLVYHASGQLDTETYSAGLLNGYALDRDYDALQRLSALSVSSVYSVGYSYDPASRLQAITQGPNTATYAYLPNSPLVGTVTFQQGATTRLTTTKVYDNLNRLTSVTNSHLPTPSSYAYAYNSANQRTRTTRENNSYWSYSYDALGQVTTSRKFDASNVPLAGHDFAWAYDDIGNRKTAIQNSSHSAYTTNSLNQHTQRTVPGVFELLAAADPAATVTYQSPAETGVPTALPRQEEFLYQQIPVDNTADAVNTPVQITGVKNYAGPNGEDVVTSLTRTAFVPKTPELFSHDADGNLTADGRWTYEWDGENRLVALQTPPQAAPPQAPGGLRGRYYNYLKETIWLGVPALVRDEAVDFDWGSGSPGPGVGSDKFNVIWTGWVEAPATGSYVFETESDDGVVFTLEGVILINNSRVRDPAIDRSSPVALVAGQRYAVTLTHFNHTGPARMRLRWKKPGDTVATVIPAAQLYHATGARARQRLEFAYDGQGRRVAKRVLTWNPSTSTYQLQTETKFLYDGWNLIVEYRLNPSTSTFDLNSTYTWGLDLSGSMQGAGGVGGLLFANTQTLDPGSQTLTPGTHAFACDGNGNVTALVDLATGLKSAAYDYNAFGETILSEGHAAAANPFRFSTKYTDDESGLLYYGFRYYNPATGRWPSRDPIMERGGANLYAFVRNNPLSSIDAIGLSPFDTFFMLNDAVDDAKAACSCYKSVVVRLSVLQNGFGIHNKDFQKVIEEVRSGFDNLKDSYEKPFERAHQAALLNRIIARLGGYERAYEVHTEGGFEKLPSALDFEQKLAELKDKVGYAQTVKILGKTSNVLSLGESLSRRDATDFTLTLFSLLPTNGIPFGPGYLKEAYRGAKQSISKMAPNVLNQRLSALAAACTGLGEEAVQERLKDVEKDIFNDLIDF